jgi:hypothetical protein
MTHAEAGRAAASSVTRLDGAGDMCGEPSSGEPGPEMGDMVPDAW